MRNPPFQAKPRALIILASMAFIGTHEIALAATVSLTPVTDATLQQAFPNNNFGDGTTITAGGRRQGGATRGLVRFDIAGNVPAGALINSVNLTLNVVGVPAGGANSVFELHRVLASWGEGNGNDRGGSPGAAGQVTWNNRLGSGSPWATAGGDYSPTVSATRSIAGSGAYTFSSSPDLVADAQSWLETPSDNFGWLLRSQSETTPTTIRRFGGREDALNRPVLNVQYSIVPEPGTFSLGVMGLLMGALFARRRPAE